MRSVISFILIFSVFGLLNAQTEHYTIEKLKILLEKVHDEDQESREKLISVLETHGKDSKEFQHMIEKMKRIDEKNTSIVTEILDERGWLGEEVIGKKGNITLFLVIQHADLNIQKQYLPMLKDAVLAGNAKASYLAMLEDRVAMGDGKKQIYGSQLKTNEETGQVYVYPILDPENVDKRRKDVGLGNLADYLKMFGVKWDIDAHINLNKN